MNCIFSLQLKSKLEIVIILRYFQCKELEEKVRDDEKAHWARVAMLIQRNKSAATTYKSLDERINLVAGKVSWWAYEIGH